MLKGYLYNSTITVGFFILPWAYESIIKVKN